MTNDRISAKSFEHLFDRKVVLYGAGVTGVEVHKILTRYFRGVEVACFCDTYKSGGMNGFPVISPDDLKRMSDREPVMIVVTALAANHSEIAGNLRRLEIPADRIFMLPEFDRMIVRNLDDSRIDDWYRTIKGYKASLPNDDRRSLYLNWWCPEHYCEGDILVYQPGKVGSSTVCNSLAAAGIDVTHVHMLTDSFIYDLIPELAWEPSAGEREIIGRSSRYCAERMKAARRLKIITLVREPLSRDYSHFFYHLGELTRNGHLSPRDSLIEACTEGMKMRATQNGKCRYGYQFEWFNKELKEVFGVDVYDHDFRKEDGYGLISQGNVDVLIVKLERLNDLAAVIADFAGARKFQLVNANQASSTKRRDLYDGLRKSMKISQELVSIYYDGNRFMDHFYGEEEKASFLEGWRRNIAG